MPGQPFSIRALAACGVLALLAGCVSTPVAGPVEVTRFHRIDTALASRGTIRLEPAGKADEDPAYPAYAAAIARQLEAQGFTLASASQGPSDEVARLTLLRETLAPSRDASRVSVGGGGSVGSYGSGVGLGIGIDLSGPPPEQIVTRMALAIDDAKSGDRLWEGRAQQAVSVKSDLARPAASAQRMAEALLKGFPGKSGETILVK